MDTHPREQARRLYLDFECLCSIPEGINEVHVWWDPILKAERVGKLIDISGLEHDASLPEPATLQAIDHPNIVPVVAAARRTDYPPPLNVVELITPYYTRGSITDALLRGERFTMTEALATAQRALRGLAELHDVFQIVHRDVKSGNVLLTEDSHKAKVADLGLAAKMDESGRAVTANNPTLYSPPEFLAGYATVAGDLYSMGLILHELIAGPFDYARYTRLSVIERLEKRLGAVPDSHRTLPPYTPRTLRTILRRSTDRNPARRYADARAMSAALARVAVIDWSQVDELQWEARFRPNDNRRMVVSAKKGRDGTYVLTARRTTLLRSRSVASVRVPSLDSPDVARLFDRATAEVLTRSTAS